MALSNNSNTLETVDSENSFVALISITFSKLIEEDKTLSPFFTTNASLSPVKDEVSNLVTPFITTPSTGTASPFLTIKISFTKTFETSS